MKARLLAPRHLAATIFLLVVLGTVPAWAQTSPGWMRYPAISPDGTTIVFTYKGDLYRVASSGGTATPLTAHAAHDFMPVWSRDGKQIAFASDRYGNFDIFVIPAEGGEPRRLTYHSAPEYPYTFTPDDAAVVFGAARMDTAANSLFPARLQPEVYQGPGAGGPLAGAPGIFLGAPFSAILVPFSSGSGGREPPADTTLMPSGFKSSPISATLPGLCVARTSSVIGVIG